MATGFINCQYSQGIPKDKVLLPLILAIYYRIDFKHGGLQIHCGKDQLFSTVFSCQYYLVLIPRFASIFFFFLVNNWGGDTRDTYITSSPRANEKYFYLAQQKSSACLVSQRQTSEITLQNNTNSPWGEKAPLLHLCSLVLMPLHEEQVSDDQL